nr:unnamed protein product [Callosobruchus analis]
MKSMLNETDEYRKLDRDANATIQARINNIYHFTQTSLRIERSNVFLIRCLLRRYQAWVAISEELEIGVPELKKLTSLLATYRKVRQKFATPGKSGSGANDVDLPPVWLTFKAFGFLHSKYKPKSTINTEQSELQFYGLIC